jgi:hypothetical protein
MNAASKQQQAFHALTGCVASPAITRGSAALLFALLLGLPCVLAPAPAEAQATLTLHGGWRMSTGLEATPPATPSPITPAPTREVQVGDSSFGMIVAGWNLDAQRDLEVQVSRQRTRLRAPAASGQIDVPLTLLTVQLGGINFFENVAGQGPYVAGGVGATRLTPDLAGGASETRPSLAVALGWAWQFKAVSLRAETRFNTILVNSSGGLFCSGGCTLAVSGNALTQLEASLGLGFRF